METRVTDRRTRAILLALSLSAFMISVDVTIVNVALPTLVRSLGANATQLQWVVDAYSLVFAALVLAAGSLSDRQGRKGTLLVGLAVFASASSRATVTDGRPLPPGQRPPVPACGCGPADRVVTPLRHLARLADSGRAAETHRIRED
jgi:hypothetical protein